MKVGYIKQSIKRTIEEQYKILIAEGCMRIYVEPSNNINFKSRVKLAEAIESITAGDTLVVTRLSVLSYSVQNLLDVMYRLEEKSVVLESIEQKFSSKDTSSLDELLYYLTEFIEDIRKEKQAIGIYKAKQKGKRLGRPSKLNLKKIEKAIYLKQFNTSEQVANRFGVGRSTLLRHIAKLKKAG